MQQKKNKIFLSVFIWGIIYINSFAQTKTYYVDVCNVISNTQNKEVQLADSAKYLLRYGCMDSLGLSEEEYFPNVENYLMKVDSSLSVKYICNGKKYSIVLRLNNFEILLDSTILKGLVKDNTSDFFTKGGYFISIKRIQLIGVDYYFCSFGAQSYHTSSINRFSPILIKVINQKIDFYLLDGFILDLPCSLSVNIVNNVPIFISYDIDTKQIVLSKFNTIGKLITKHYCFKSMDIDTFDNELLLSNFDLKVLKAKIKQFVK